MHATRRVDIDGLRVVATYLLFVFHVGKVFDPAPFFHVWNGERSIVFLVVCGFISLCHMPLFFLLAGWSAASSLRVRGAGGFLAERLRRLFVPLVAGCLLLAPVIKYVELRGGLDLNHRGLWVGAEHQEALRAVLPGGLPLLAPFDERFLDFLPTFFTQLDRFTWSHLWFVAYLFTMTIVYLPALVWLVGRRPMPSASGWMAYAPLVPLVAIQLTLREGSRGIYNLYDDWANVAYYSVFLVAGALLACHPAVERVVDVEWKRSLGVATAAALLLLLGVVGVGTAPPVLLVATAVAGWCFVVTALGLGRRWFRGESPTLAYLSESAFPVYVLHQLAIVLPGHFVVGLALGVATKFVLLLLLAVAITMGTYHWLVRPYAVPRVLLGMKRPAGGVRVAIEARPVRQPSR